MGTLASQSGGGRKKRPPRVEGAKKGPAAPEHVEAHSFRRSLGGLCCGSTMKEQWRKTLSAAAKAKAFPRLENGKVLKNMEKNKARLIQIELPLPIVRSQKSSVFWKCIITALELFVLLCLLYVLIWIATALYKDNHHRASKTQVFYDNDPNQNSMEFKSQINFIEEQLRQQLLEQLRQTLLKSSTTTTTSTTTNAPYTRQVELEDIAALMARRLEPIVGHHEELLVWYYMHRAQPDFLQKNDKLKVHVAKLLFDSKIGDFNNDAAMVLDLMIDDAYREDFRRLTDPDEGGFKPENKYQRYIVDRLMMKWRYNKQVEEKSQLAEKVAKAIETRNRLELWMLRMRPEDLEAGNKGAKEERSPDNWNVVSTWW